MKLAKLHIFERKWPQFANLRLELLEFNRADKTGILESTSLAQYKPYFLQNTRLEVCGKPNIIMIQENVLEQC